MVTSTIVNKKRINGVWIKEIISEVNDDEKVIEKKKYKRKLKESDNNDI